MKTKNTTVELPTTVEIVCNTENMQAMQFKNIRQTLENFPEPKSN